MEFYMAMRKRKNYCYMTWMNLKKYNFKQKNIDKQLYILMIQFIKSKTNLCF